MEGKNYKNFVLDALSKAVEDVFGHPLSHYNTSCRKRECVEIRQMAMALYHEETDFSSNEVGEVFNRNHTTVLHSYEMVASLVKYDKAFKYDFEKLREKFKNYLCEN